MRHRICLMTAAAAACLTSAASSPASAPSPLEGVNFLLTALGSDLAPLRGGTTPTLTLANGKARGTDGCNTYITSATADAEGNITIDATRAISTMRACPEPVMQRAQAFKDALSSATRYSADADSLTLFDAAGTTVATFSKADTTLIGTAWEVTGYNNGKQAVVSVLSGTTLTAEFRPEGRVSGSAGCNRYTASYETDGSKIEITTPALTRRLCPQPEGIMQQEAQFAAALASAATYRMDGDRLELRTAEGHLAVSLRRAQNAPPAPPTPRPRD
ncbi:MAG: META domain-containing protein [Candidatus Sumerlaeaceae bacterium]|nr:META domain-containing protein [Candidatus Sumerlaeaceae bacterium]